MVQTRRTLEGPQASQSQQAGGNGSTRVQHLGDDPAPAVTLPRVGVENNYDDGMSGEESQGEITKLRLENQALQLLLREQLKKSISLQAEDGDEVSSTRRFRPTNRSTLPPVPPVQNHSKAQSEGPVTEKGKGVHIATPNIPTVHQRQSVFERLTEKDSGPKVWTENDLRRLISSTVTGKAIPHTPRGLARKSLGGQNSSPLAQQIADAPPPKTFFAPKFSVYNGRTDPADHVRYYQQVMAN